MILGRALTFVGYYLTLGFFGAFGLTLSFAALLCGCLPATDRTERFFQRLIHRSFALFIWWVTISRQFRVSYERLEKLPPRRRGLVVIANHPTLTDITCLRARLPEAVCIFKSAIRRNPVLGAAARRAGYLSGDGGFDVVRQVTDQVAAGHTVIIFPEGTRTPVGESLLPLKPGFLLIARRAGVPIQLVRLTCSRPVLAKGRAWWKLPPLPAKMQVAIGPCLRVSPTADTDKVTAEIAAWFRASPDAAACHVWSPALTLDEPLKLVP